MHHTYQINTSQLGSAFIESVKSIFGNSEVKIIVEEIEVNSSGINHSEVARFLSHRKSHPSVRVTSQDDFNDLVQDLNL